MSLEVHSARPGDGGIAWMLAREVAEHNDELHLFKATPEDFEEALFGPSSVCGCELAIVDHEPAGQAFWHRSYSIYRGKPCIYLEDLFVRGQYRRKGVARALMQRLAGVADREGFPVIYWLMMDTNAVGEKFYKRIGAGFETGMRFYRLQGDALRELAAP